MNFEIVFSISVKSAFGILIKMAPNLYIALCSVDVLPILIILIPKLEICFYLFVSSSVFSLIFYDFECIDFSP